MKKVMLAVSIILILLGLDVAVFRHTSLVAIVYLLAGGILIAYSSAYDRVTKSVKITISIVYTIPVTIIAFLAIYGSIHTTAFTEDVVFILGAGLDNN